MWAYLSRNAHSPSHFSALESDKLQPVRCCVRQGMYATFLSCLCSLTHMYYSTCFLYMILMYVMTGLDPHAIGASMGL